MANEFRYAFGEWVRKRRIEQEMGLREFCRSRKVDVGNWSKLERGIMCPPADKELQREIVRDVLQITEQHPDYYRLFAMMDDACEAFKRPHKPSEGKELVSVLPFCPIKADGTRMSEEELRKLVEFIQAEETPRDYDRSAVIQ